MGVAAMVLGIIGGLFGIAGSLFALGVGALGSAAGTVGASQVVGLGWVALALSVVGILGAALALARPKLSGILMLVSAIGGLVAISFGYIVAAPLLFLGGILALVRRRTPARP